VALRFAADHKKVETQTNNELRRTLYHLIGNVPLAFSFITITDGVSQPPRSPLPGFSIFYKAKRINCPQGRGFEEASTPETAETPMFFDQVPGELHVVWKPKPEMSDH